MIFPDDLPNDFPDDFQLDRWVAEGWSDRVARRRSARRMKAIRKNICALANDLPGHGEAGVLLIGVEHDGAVADLECGDRTLQRLVDLGRDGTIRPLPTLRVQKRKWRGREIVVILVEPSEVPPVRSDGVVWVRVGPTVRAATPDEERRVGRRRRAGEVDFDRRPARGARLADLDQGYLRSRCLPRAVAPEVPAQDERPPERQLRSLRLFPRGSDCPAWGALLAFARDPGEWLPGAYVQFLRFDGRRRSDPVSHREVIAGRLEEVVLKLERLMDRNLSVETQIVGPGRESRNPDYPIEALRQLARNALMHRTYETNIPVRVCWYSDRVEITSPGGLYGIMNRKNFGGDLIAYRNPLVAEIMVRLGLARRFGVGIPTVYRELERNGNPEPIFDIDSRRVRAVVRSAS